MTVSFPPTILSQSERMKYAITRDTISAALALDDFDVSGAQSIMAPMRRPTQLPPSIPGDATPAAVLLLLYPQDDTLGFVLIQRNSYEGVHSDQIGLPGGRQEDGEDFLETALRETHEELGVDPAAIDVIGNLTPIYIPPSDYHVHPFVGFVPQRPTWQPDPREVAAVIETTVDTLLDETLKSDDTVNVQGMRIRVPYYDIDGHKCWGATAIMLAEFEGRIRQALYQ